MRSAALAIRVLQVVVLVAVVAAFAIEFARDRPQGGNLGTFLLNLRSPDAETRREAALGLRRLRLSGDEASPVALAFGDRLDDGDEGVCEAAADVLVGLGTGASPAVPAALRLVRGTPENVRARALLVLAVAGTPEGDEALEAALFDAQSRVRLQAIHAVTVARRPALLSMVVRRLAVEPDADLRIRAHRALAATDPHSDPVIDAECLGLRDPDPAIRREVATKLRASASPKAEVAEALRGAIHDPVPAVRTVAYEALVAIGLRQPRAISVLFEAAKDPATLDEARIAIGGLSSSESLRFGPHDNGIESRRSSYPTLVRVLNDPDPWLRRTMAEFVVSYLTILEWSCGEECQADRDNLIAALASKWRSRDRAIRQVVLLRLLRMSPSKTMLSLFRTLMEIDAHATSASTGMNPRDGEGSEASASLASLGRPGMALERKSLIALLPDNLLRPLLPEIRGWLIDGDENSRSTAFWMIESDLLFGREDLFPLGGATRHWMLEAMREAVGRDGMGGKERWIRQELEPFHRRDR